MAQPPCLSQGMRRRSLHRYQPQSPTRMVLRRVHCIGFVLILLQCGLASNAQSQQKTLEQRQPLESVYADSIVPQDRHETMLTTGVWYFRKHASHHASLTQKIEWGISDALQVSTTMQLMNSSNLTGSMKTGIGDIEIGARYTWPRVYASRPGSRRWSHYR
jgi:hypothetical protein